jgi:hypothetical protein
LLLHDRIGYANAPQGDVLHTLPVLFTDVLHFAVIRFFFGATTFLHQVTGSSFRNPVLLGFGVRHKHRPADERCNIPYFILSPEELSYRNIVVRKNGQ